MTAPDYLRLGVTKMPLVRLMLRKFHLRRADSCRPIPRLSLVVPEWAGSGKGTCWVVGFYMPSSRSPLAPTGLGLDMTQPFVDFHQPATCCYDSSFTFHITDNSNNSTSNNSNNKSNNNSNKVSSNLDPELSGLKRARRVASSVYARLV